MTLNAFLVMDVEKLLNWDSVRFHPPFPMCPVSWHIQNHRQLNQIQEATSTCVCLFYIFVCNSPLTGKPSFSQGRSESAGSKLLMVFNLGRYEGLWPAISGDITGRPLMEPFFFNSNHLMFQTSIVNHNSSVFTCAVCVNEARKGWLSC